VYDIRLQSVLNRGYYTVASTTSKMHSSRVGKIQGGVYESILGYVEDTPVDIARAYSCTNDCPAGFSGDYSEARVSSVLNIYQCLLH